MSLSLAKSWLVPLAMALVVCDGCPHPWHSHGGLAGSPDPGCRVKRSETLQTTREDQPRPEASPDPDGATALGSTVTVDRGQPQAVEEYVAASEAEDMKANSTDEGPTDAPSETSDDMETQASVGDAISRSFLLPFHLPLQHPPRPPPPRRPPPHRPPPPHHPPTRHPPVPDLGPPQELHRPEFDFDFDPPDFFQTSGFPSAENHFGPAYMDDEEFFEPHPQDDHHPPFPSHPPEHASPYLPPKPFPIEEDSPPPYEHYPSESPPAGEISYHHLPPNINFIMEDSIYRKDVPMKDVQNNRDKIHDNLAPAGIKGLDPELLEFIKQHTESYKKAAGATDGF
ncbi:uncharacterized protein [Panulirus ornatus]|uniref:uncharacterized protein n=1 Tax=Panulirus ornatus TaxID=150431 RepID=UPI003A8BB617